MYELAWAAITKYHRLGDLYNRNLLSYVSGDLKSKIKVVSGLIYGETSLPDVFYAILYFYFFYWSIIALQ